jgi:hypothetical protein
VAGIKFTTEQKQVIDFDPKGHLLVEAGPGTGKTAVACQRVAGLIDKAGISPTEILLVSFTRAAVIELRNRIASYLLSPADADAVVISTIDSLTYRIRRGFSSGAVNPDTYEESVLEFSKTLQENANAREFIKGWKHVIIDEAQDIFSPRAEAILDILDFLDKSCGVTIFCDQAQAIYGFTKSGEDVFEEAPQQNLENEEIDSNEEEALGSSEEYSEFEVDDSLLASKNLVSVLGEYASTKYERLALTKIHRTADKNLLNLLRKGRKLLLVDDHSGKAIHRDLTDLITISASETVEGRTVDLLEEMDPSSLVLYRNRAEVLEAAEFAKPNDHRLRLSGRPVLIHPWIGILFGDLGLEKIGAENFQRLWEARLSDLESISRGDAWDLLVTHAGLTKDVVSLRTLAKVLSARPPEAFCLPEYGFRGPILGTIHASKGREADVVYLSLQKGSKQANEKALEEAKVAYVGASRARSKLVFSESKFKLSSKQGKRNFSRVHRGKAQVEFGLKGDLVAEGLVGEFYLENSNLALEAQEFLVENALNTFRLKAIRTSPDLNWAYKLLAPKANQVIGYLNPSVVNGDLFAIKKRVNGYRNYLPAEIDHLWSFGSYTLVVNPDHPDLDVLLPPWRESYFMLAPMLSGYPTIYFN